MKRVVATEKQHKVSAGFNDFTADALIKTCEAIQSAIGTGEGPPLKLEVFTVAAFFDEGEWSSAWLQFMTLAMRSKDGCLPKLSLLQLDVPAALRYMLSDDSPGFAQSGATMTVKVEEIDDGSEMGKSVSNADKQYLDISN